MSFNSRLGLVLFGIYCLVYFGFVLVNAFAPGWISSVAWGGLNLAVWWGMGLILLAFGLALLYGWLCRDESLPGIDRDSSHSA